MPLSRVVLEWAGPQIKGRAVSVLHFYSSTPTAPNVVSLQSQLGFLGEILPTGCTITVPTSGDVIDPTTGALTDVWTGSTTSAVAGAAGAAAAAGVGGCITWDTGAVLGGKRLRGRTFIVPMGANSYDTDGTLTTTAKGKIDQAAAGIRGLAGFAIWKRPTAPGASDGGYATVAAHRVADKVAILTSRRD